jgi:hypothetical protein
VVQFRGDKVELILGEAAQVSLLVQVLAQQSIGVLVGAARCQGWCGSQKNTGIDSAALITAWWAISRPRSQVNDRRRWLGRHPICSINARATASALCPLGSATTIV